MSWTHRAVVATLLAGTYAPRVFAQTGFPDKPLRLIVPFAPGGNADLTAIGAAGFHALYLGDSHEEVTAERVFLSFVCSSAPLFSQSAS